ncbi:hypothetical protein PI27_gp126 [Listeria phage WIL-1]|nr:hypothetical protein PI27_gp126 [Listeria phage WIL-1]
MSTKKSLVGYLELSRDFTFC